MLKPVKPEASMQGRHITMPHLAYATKEITPTRGSTRSNGRRPHHGNTMRHARSSTHGGNHSDHDSISRRHPGDRSLLPALLRHWLPSMWLLVIQAPRTVLLHFWVLADLALRRLLRMRHQLALSWMWPWDHFDHLPQLCASFQHWARPWGRPFDHLGLRLWLLHFASSCAPSCFEPMGGSLHRSLGGNFCAISWNLDNALPCQKTFVRTPFLDVVDVALLSENVAAEHEPPDLDPRLLELCRKAVDASGLRHINHLCQAMLMFGIGGDAS